MIIKLQRPLASTDENPPWLAYSDKTSFRVFIDDADIPDGIKKAMRNDLKGYFEATLDSSGRLKFGARVKAQEW